MLNYRSKQPLYRPFPKNVLIYDGPSMLNGERIFVVGTAQNGNRKIGKMLQFWIFPDAPLNAVKSGADAAVCGQCAMRGDGLKGRSCYVYLPGVDNIWQARAKATVMKPCDFALKHPGLQLRLGAYGDPVAVPASVWEPLLKTAAGWTAYTHQWREPLANRNGFARWCMASVEDDAGTEQAKALGWRTFRARVADTKLYPHEIICPHEQDAATQCDSCSLCRGAARPAKSIVVTVHGSGAKNFLSMKAVRDGATSAVLQGRTD